MRLFPVASGQAGSKKTILGIQRAVFAFLVAALFASCGGCTQCKSCASGDDAAKVIRTPADVTDFSIVFIDGVATLYWIDSPDTFLDHIEITWDPDGKVPVQVGTGVEIHTVPGLKVDQMYNFTVRAVDQWGNKSLGTTGGTGKAFKQNRLPAAPPSEIMGIKGTPVAGQMIVSWTNLDPSEYEHIEITYDPNHEKLIRVPKGVESRMLMDLVNGVEHTVYVAAVDAQGNRKPVDVSGLFISEAATSPESVYGRPTNGQITLVWNDPVNPNLDHLEVVYSPHGETPVTVAKGTQTKTFTNLSDSTQYEFTVYAADTAGHRRPVTGVDLLTPSAVSFTEEDAEAFVIKGKPAAGQIRLDWDDPVMSGLDHIEIIYNPGGGDLPIRVARGDETKLFSGLSDSEEYSFIVYGVDARGNKRAMKGVTLSTPKAPAPIAATPVTGQVTITWKDPDYSNLDHVELTYSPGGETPVIVPKGVERHTFTGLSDNIKYEFTVKGVSKEGNTHAFAATGAIVPEIPVIKGIPTDGRLAMVWDDPPGVKLDHVEIVYTPGGENVRLVAGGMENQTFTGLTDGREYSFTVYGVDEAGNKHPVRAARFLIPETPIATPPPPPVRTGELGTLTWRPSNDTTFGDSTVLALAYGSVATGAHRWVAGGTDGKIAYSNDNGVNWISVVDSTFGSFSVNAIGYNNNRWIAGGNSGKMAWSTNAVNWTAVGNTRFASDSNINTVVFGNGRWLAGGTNGAIVWSSDNGATWNPVSIAAFSGSAVNTLAFHGSRWLAGSSNGKMAYSDDNGLTWTAVANTGFGEAAVNIIVYDRNRWLAAGNGVRIAWSSDGVTWRNLTRPFYVLGMGYNGYRWVAGGQEGRMAWSGDSGDNWTQDDQGRSLFGDSWVQAVAYGASGATGRWLSGGQYGKILYADEP